MRSCKRNIRTNSPIIFVSGPYTGETPCERDGNIAIANAAAQAIVLIGLEMGLTVRVFVPHNNTGRWDDDHRFADRYSYFMRCCYDWILDTADALYYTAPSPGSRQELTLAEAIGVPVLRSGEDVRRWLLEWKESHPPIARALSG